jgi:hypothetical protein
MKKHLLILFTITCFNSFRAQNFDWVRRMSGPINEGGLSVAADASGNVYSAGYFGDTLDCNPGGPTYTLAAQGVNDDIFVAKHDASGNFVWAVNIGGAQTDAAFCLKVDAAGNILIAGVYTGTVDFDPGPGTYTMGGGQGNAFLLKLDPAGNFLWAKNFAGIGNDQIYSIALDGAGNIHLAGFFSFTVDFDPGPGVYNLTNIAGDAFVCKLDPAGNFLWARQMGGNGFDFAIGLAVDASGNVYSSGGFRNTADFDPGVGVFNLVSSATLGQANGFISKLDAAGNFIWALGYIGTGYCDFGHMAIAPGGDLVATGYYKGNFDFDPGAATSMSVSTGLLDVFIVRLNPAGIPQWTKFIGGPGDQIIYGCAIDAGGTIYAAGQFAGISDFDPGVGVSNLTAIGLQDIFVQQLDGSGNLVSVYTAGSPGDDFAGGMSIDPQGNVYFCGGYSNNTVFAPNVSLPAAGQYDAFVMKFKECSSLITTQPVNVSVWPNNNVQFGIVSGGSSFQWQQNMGFGFTNLSNGGQFSGVTTATLTISSVGPLQNSNFFRCLVTGNTCSVMSTSAKLTLLDDTGMEELIGQQAFQVVPNPATDFITLQTPVPMQGQKYRVSDQTGRVVLSGIVVNNGTSINLAGLASGLYLVHVDGANLRPQKIIKQ